MSPRLTPGYEPWRPLFVAALPDLENELRQELGPIRARTLALELVDDGGIPVLTVTINTGDPDERRSERILSSWLVPIVAPVPGMRLQIDFVAKPELRSVE